MTPHFKQKAALKELSFFRKYGRNGYTFFTVKGNRPNILHKITNKYIYVCTEKGKKANRVPRESLRKALAILFYRRVITLKQLIKLNSFSSTLAAIIKAIMIDICKVALTKTGAVRLTLRGLRYIYSGLSKGKDDVRIVKEHGGHFVLLNYYNIRSDLTDSWKENLRMLGFGYRCVIVDPGEKTLYDAMQKGIPVKPIDIDDYAAFIRRHEDIIFQYLTVDKIGDPITTRRNTEYLERVVGRKPVPIYHIQSPLDILQEYVDEGYDVIAIGGSALKSVSHQKRVEAFDAIFSRFGDDANFHALGLGSMNLLLRYPWFSADASSWLNGRIFRRLISIAGDVLAPKWMSAEDALGYNIRMLAALEERYTDLQIDFDMLPPSMA